jgi:ActR/RegA family two-component response regulator
MSIRLLFVDDEEGIRITLAEILRRNGFEVTVAAEVREAIGIMNSQAFDVLLTDLNIGQPGDGFTVVSAMRRIQPDVLCMILTGYPAFETALQAIRDQVDDYIVKPADVDTLVENIRSRLVNRSKRSLVQLRRVPAMVQEYKEEVIRRWLATMESDPEISRIPLNAEERRNHIDELLNAIVNNAEHPEAGVTGAMRKAAEIHGTRRFHQGYSLPLLVRETRLLQDTIAHLIQENLLVVDISWLVPDLIAVGHIIEQLLEESIRAFIVEQTAPMAH